jgi:hypothetical protein
MDVPCSSDGKINLSNEKSYSNWSEELVNNKNKIQKMFCDKIMPLLKNE